MVGIIVPRFHFYVIGLHRGQEFGCLFGILTVDDGGRWGLIAHIVVGGGGGVGRHGHSHSKYVWRTIDL